MRAIVKNKRVLFVVLVACAFLVTKVAFATYETWENIPGSGTTDSLTTYLGFIYSFLIGISGILAIIMIGVGAFIYMVTSAGNAAKMADGKDMIYSAIYGLVIALIAWLILFVINPDLVTNGVISGVPGLDECSRGAEHCR